jgi:cytochrome P450
VGHPKLKDFDDPNYNIELPDEIAFGDVLDPFPALRELAMGGPVQERDFRALQGMATDPMHDGKRIFSVIGYEELREAFSNTDNFCSENHKDGVAQTFGPFSLTVLDPPEHSRFRRIFQKAFLPHVVGTWSKEFVEPVIDGLIDKIANRKSCDLMTEFIRPYPFEIIYRQLRLPPDDAKIFYRLAMVLTLFIGDFAAAREAHVKLGEFFQEVINERRKGPGTDLISVLATTNLDGEYLPDEVLVSFFRQLLNAAGDTTYRSTGSMMVGLLSERPDQFELLKKDRSLVAKAIEETLRWEGPVNMTLRQVKRDTVLGGVKMPAGSLVHMITGVANRDPSIYPNPDEFDILRPHSRPHLAFAAGPHVCLGQHLARLEMTRALNALMDRLPNLRLDPDHPKPEIRGNIMRVPRQLHVRLD